MKVAMPLAKNVLAPLGLTAAMSAIDGSIQQNIHGSGVKLIIEQEDMNDIMKIIEALENFRILLKGVSKTIENETKEQRGGFLSMLLGTLGASLLGNLLTGKGIMRAGNGIVRAGEGSGSKKKNNLNSLLPFHPLTNIEINEYYKNEPRFNGVYSRNNLPKTIKKGPYVINLDEYENTGTHWVSLFVKPKYTVYFDSFGVEHISKEINKFINNDIESDIFRLQAYVSIMCGYFCIKFINYMLKGKTFLDYTNYFLLMTLKRMIELLKEYLRMNNLELTNVNKYRLDEINKIKEYFDNEIKERKDIIKKLNKYLVSFDYLDKIFITLLASFSTLSIASYASVLGLPVGIAGSFLTLIFTISAGINKSLLKVTKIRKKKHNKIIALAKSKLNTIDTLLSTALNDSKISHEEFTNIIDEKNIYENVKENIKNTTGSSPLERTIEPTELPSIAELTAGSLNVQKYQAQEKN